RLPDVETVQRQALLQLVALGDAEYALVAGPRLNERAVAAQPIGEMSDGERIGLRRVVLHDDPEIVEHQERRTAGAGRYQQIGAVGRARKEFPADPLHAQPLPFLQGELAGTIGPQVVEARRGDDLVAPGLAGDPAVHAQIVRGRGDHVGNGIDDVAPAIAVEVDRVALERRGHELRRSGRARPGAFEAVPPDVAAMDNLEGGEEFLPEIVLAPADARERRGRLQHGTLADRAAEIRFDTPDRRDDVTIDPVGLLDRREGRLIFRQDLLSGGDARVADQEIEIVPQRLGELRLRIEKIHDVQIWFEIRRVSPVRL